MTGDPRVEALAQAVHPGGVWPSDSGEGAKALGRAWAELVLARLDAAAPGAGPVRDADEDDLDVVARLANSIADRHPASETEHDALTIVEQVRTYRCAPAPSVAAPPRESARVAVNDLVRGVTGAGFATHLVTDGLDEGPLVVVVDRWDEPAAAPGTVRDPERIRGGEPR